DPMLLDARRVADSERGRVDEADARTRAALGMEVDREGDKEPWHEFHEAGIAHHARKFLAQGHLHLLGVEAFEGPIAGLLEENEDGEDLGRMQSGCPTTAALAGGEQFAFPQRLKALPKGVHRAKEVEHIHHDTSSSG